jgi:hypothetical protein
MLFHALLRDFNQERNTSVHFGAVVLGESQKCVHHSGQDAWKTGQGDRWYQNQLQDTDKLQKSAESLQVAFSLGLVRSCFG